MQTTDGGVTLNTTSGHPTVKLNDEIGLDFRGFPLNARYEIWFTINDSATSSITRVYVANAPEPYQDVYAVPEPTSLTILAAAFVAACLLRRNR